jgi:demethylmenaquinone methyltransferase/2-methoxy-6-polyprenyl-1,4-benzoquinol methylase
MSDAALDMVRGLETTDGTLPPHPELPAYYGRAGGRGSKAAFLREIFDATAGDYDRLERIVALGSGSWHRREALRRAGLSRGMRMLDVATGTGMLAREAIELLGANGQVFGVDPSLGMLRQARSLPNLRPILGLGEALPLADASFDFVAMGYALRHLPDLRIAFGEFFRVLRPGGRICILELLRPSDPVRRRLLDGYFRLLLPIVTRVVTRSPRTAELWRYYWDTIDRCVPPQIVLAALRDAGFSDVRRGVSFGLFSEFTAQRPATVPLSPYSGGNREAVGEGLG